MDINARLLNAGKAGQILVEDIARMRHRDSAGSQDYHSDGEALYRAIRIYAELIADAVASGHYPPGDWLDCYKLAQKVHQEAMAEQMAAHRNGRTP